MEIQRLPKQVAEPCKLEVLLPLPLPALHLRHVFADIVAKLSEGSLARNIRIGTSRFLNQRCASRAGLESILLAETSKIVLQQYLPRADGGGTALEKVRNRER